MKSTEPILKSEFSTYFSSSLGFHLFFGAIGVLICYLLCSELTLNDWYLNEFIGLGFGFLGLYMLYKAYAHDRLIIYANRLVIKSLLGYTKKEIYLNEITGWSETMKFTTFSRGSLTEERDPYSHSSYFRWFQFAVYTPVTRYKLQSHLYTNYPAIRKLLTDGKNNVATPDS